MAETQDALDRKGTWLLNVWDKLFSGIKDNPVVAFLVISLLLNVYQFHLNNEKTDLIIGIVDKQKEEMIKEVRSTVSKQIEPIKLKQDSTNKRLDTSLTEFDNTVKTFKKKYNK